MPHYVETVFDFQGSEGQLSFSVGQLIEVISQGEPNEWWEGSLGGVVGWFPSAYCSPPFEEGIDVSEEQDAPTKASALQARALYDFAVRLPPHTRNFSRSRLRLPHCSAGSNTAGLRRRRARLLDRRPYQRHRCRGRLVAGVAQWQTRLLPFQLRRAHRQLKQQGLDRRRRGPGVPTRSRTRKQQQRCGR